MKIKLMCLPFLLGGCTALVPQVPTDTVTTNVVTENKKVIANYESSTKQRILNSVLPTYKLKVPTFDLVVKNASIKDVLPALAEDTEYVINVDDDVTEKITANWKGKSFNEIIVLLKRNNGFGIYKEGKNIYVSSPHKLSTRVYQLSYLNAKRIGRTESRVSSGSVSDTQSSTSNSSNSSSPGVKTGESSKLVTEVGEFDFWEKLKSDLMEVKGKEGNVNVNSISGLITVTALNSKQSLIEEYIKKTQATIERQVMLEAKIIEVTLSKGSESGINWSYYGGSNHKFGISNVAQGTQIGATGSLTNSSVVSNPGANGSITGLPAVSAISALSGIGGGFFGLAYQAANFASLISFLESQGSVSVLSSPRIATLNNQQAILKVGTDDLFVTSITTNTTSNNSTSTTSPSINVQPFFSGIALDVTPRIDNNNNVVLHIRPSVSEVSEKTKILHLGTMGDFNLPLASSNVNEADSVVKVPNGRIVAIGGLMSHRISGSSSAVPGLEFATRNQGKTDVKTELVILLKPTVIESFTDWDKQ